MGDINKSHELDSIDENIDKDNLTNEQVDTEINVDADDNLTEDIEQKLAELNDSYLRLHADFDNYRRRTMKEKADLIKFGNEKAIQGILPLVDDFERALEIVPETQREGIELIYSKFNTFLTQNGVKATEAIGQAFNSDLHEAITTIPAQSEDQKNVIVDCVQKGYAMNDKIIRFAKVIVAK